MQIHHRAENWIGWWGKVCITWDKEGVKWSSNTMISSFLIHPNPDKPTYSSEAARPKCMAALSALSWLGWMVVNSLGACGALWTSRKVCSIRLQGLSPRYVRCSRDRHMLNKRGNRSIESSGKELSRIHTAFTMRVRNPTGLNSRALRKAITWLLNSEQPFRIALVPPKSLLTSRPGNIQTLVAVGRRACGPRATEASKTSRTISIGNLKIARDVWTEITESYFWSSVTVVIMMLELSQTQCKRGCGCKMKSNSNIISLHSNLLLIVILDVNFTFVILLSYWIWN